MSRFDPYDYFLIYDFVNEKQINEIKKWSEKLQKNQRAKLNEKLDKLRLSGDELMPETLTGTSIAGIKKLRIRCQNVQLRPLVCNGPINSKKEFTLLLGATERDNKLNPLNAENLADINKHKIIIEPHQRRILHEKVK